MRARGGGSVSKGGGKSKSGGETVKITKSKALQTKAVEDKVLRLRQALFNDDGKDKNVLAGIAPSFLKFDRSGANVSISLSPKLSEDEVDWAFELSKSNMEDRYEASGYGWDDEDKERELTEGGARFLLVKSTETDELIGFAHFRFTVQGEVLDQMIGEPCLYVMDLHIEEAFQRKGLGRHLLVLLELIARREQMTRVSFPVYLGDESTQTWLAKQRGYVIDDSFGSLGFDPDMEGFTVYSKTFASPVTTPVKTVAVVAAVTPSTAEATPSKDTTVAEFRVVEDVNSTSAEAKGCDDGKIAVISPRSKDSAAAVVVETVEDGEDEENEWVHV